MAFFDELQKSVTDAANYTAKKATEFSGIAKLKFNIRSEEANLEKCFADIGKLFYTAEREGVDRTAEIAALIMQVDKIRANIDGYRDELSRLKKTVICKACSAEVAKDFAFCPSCGAKLEKNSDCADSCDCNSNDESCCCGDSRGCDCVEEDNDDGKDNE